MGNFGLKYLSLIIFFFSALSYAGEKEDISSFVNDFAANLRSSTESKDFDKFFVGSPIFFIGQQPVLSDNPKFVESMVGSIRDALDLERYPFGKVVIESLYMSEDGTATMTVVFEREESKSEWQKAICSIFSTVKVGGSWKISGWYVSSSTKPDSCTWA